MAKKQFSMNDDQKAKYAELFISALDAMEGAQWQEPWVAPRHCEPQNYKHKKPYRGMNNFFLTLLCAVRGWEVPMFLTFDQIKDMGLSLNMLIKDGVAVIKDNGMPAFESSFPVVKKLTTIYHNGKKITLDEYDELTDDEKDECRWYPSLRKFPEFNLQQTDFAVKFPEKWEHLTKLPPHDYEVGVTDAVLDCMIFGKDGWRCPIEFGGHEASYTPSKDRINLPERSHFKGDTLFYSTALHEMAHSTAPEFKRDVEHNFGTNDYAMEEFVAELTSACVCSMLGIGKLLDEQHVAYVQNWRQALRDPKSDFITNVIDHVQSATNFILRRYDAIAKQMRGPLALPLAA